jgi:hypothetical protein
MDYFARLLEPPDIGFDQSLNPLEKVTHVRHRLGHGPLQTYFRSRLPPNRMYWRFYNLLVRGLAGLAAPPNTEAARMSYWHGWLTAADVRATAYGMRVRSTFIWVASLTALSVTLAIISPIFELGVGWATSLSFGELSAVLVVAFAMLGTRWASWNQRWRDYRKLAELFRAQQTLAPFGEVLPAWIRQVSDRTSPVPTEQGQWVNWLFAAVSRTASVPSLSYSAETLAQVRDEADRFLEFQERYHEDVSERILRADARSVTIDLISFLIVFLLVGVKAFTSAFASLPKIYVEVLDVLVTVVPVLAINLAAIRAAIRFRLQADKSHALRHAIKRARDRLGEVQLTRPLASQDLIAIARNIAATMVHDTDERLAASDD